MSTVKKQSSVKPLDKSDVLSILESIESMYQSYMKVMNVYAQTTLLLSITIESFMLFLKLRVMRDRWTYHLPFKEASTVDFYDWSKKFEKMSQNLGGNAESTDDVTPYCPSKHFMLDLYEILPDKAPSTPDDTYYLEQNVAKLISAQDRICKLITRQWTEYNIKFSDMVIRQFKEEISGLLESVNDISGSIRATCQDVFRELSYELNKLYEMPSGVIPRESFERLAQRVISEPEYGGRKAQAAARREVDELRNTTPVDEWEKRRRDNINTSLDVISEMKYGRRVFDFMRRNFNLEKQYAEFGKYLYSVRRNIGTEELSFLMEQLFRILYLSQETVTPEPASSVEQTVTTQREPGVQPAPNPKDAQAVYQRRLDIKPEYPRLPPYFNQAFQTHPQAVQQFYDIFHHCGFYIGRVLLDNEKRNRNINYYAGWKWKHVREAFINLKFILPDSPKNALADYLESVFPYLDANNVKRGFNSRGTYENATIFNSIVHNIEEEFQCVKKMLEE